MKPFSSLCSSISFQYLKKFIWPIRRKALIVRDSPSSFLSSLGLHFLLNKVHTFSLKTILLVGEVKAGLLSLSFSHPSTLWNWPQHLLSLTLFSSFFLQTWLENPLPADFFCKLQSRDPVGPGASVPQPLSQAMLVPPLLSQHVSCCSAGLPASRTFPRGALTRPSRAPHSVWKSPQFSAPLICCMPHIQLPLSVHVQFPTKT